MTAYFKALTDFYSEDTRSGYVQGMIYRVRPGNDKLASLVGLHPDKPGPWRLQNLVELHNHVGAVIDGSDAPPPTWLDRIKALSPFVLAFMWCVQSLALWAVTHPTAVRTIIADTVVDLLDVGTTDTTGDLRFLTAGDVEVALLLLSNPAFGAAASGVATASAITSDTNADGGTITKAALRNRDNTDRILCSVTATGGGGDIELSSVVISAGQTVSVSSLTYTAPA